MSDIHQYRYLERRPRSMYRQLFVKGTRIRAEILYSLTVPSAEDGEVYAPEEVAAAYGLPVEAVHEAIDYCHNHWDEVVQDHGREERLADASGENDPDYKYHPKEHYRPLTPEEWARLTRDEAVPG
jgi:uncharacterized protein (DUF433 family)